MSPRVPEIKLDIRTGGKPDYGIEGYFLTWLRASEKPIVVWWSRLQTDWRDGGRIVQVTAWAGPLPAARRRA